MYLQTTLPRTAALACSREGAGIGEGIAAPVAIVLAVVVVVYLVAVISAIAIGRRRAAVGRQLVLHLASATGVLVAAPLLIFGLAMAWNAIADYRVRRDTAAIEVWLAPLKQPIPGGVDEALSAVLDAEGADAANRVAYLIAALPDLLDGIDLPLDDDDRAAAQSAARRLRQANERLDPGSDPGNLERLDAAVAWLVARPDLPGALRACEARNGCVIQVLEAADRWCSQHRPACRQAFDAARLDAAEALARGDAQSIYRMQSIRGRVKSILLRD